jgi:RNA polymerase sigma-70 factor (ECF subfamily)
MDDEHDLPGETTVLVNRHRPGSPGAGDDLLVYACDRLRRLARRMLRCQNPDLRRWEQTDDVLQGALIRMRLALSRTTLDSSAHFWHLAALQVRRELHDLLRHHRGPQSFAANHDTGHGDEDGVPRWSAACGEPSSPEQWGDFLEMVAALPGELRQVFDLLWTQGLTQEKAAEKLDVSVRTIRRRWDEAKEHLRTTAQRQAS